MGTKTNNNIQSEITYYICVFFINRDIWSNQFAKYKGYVLRNNIINLLVRHCKMINQHKVWPETRKVNPEFTTKLYIITQIHRHYSSCLHW